MLFSLFYHLYRMYTISHELFSTQITPLLFFFTGSIIHNTSFNNIHFLNNSFYSIIACTINNNSKVNFKPNLISLHSLYNHNSKSFISYWLTFFPPLFPFQFHSLYVVHKYFLLHVSFYYFLKDVHIYMHLSQKKGLH